MDTRVSTTCPTMNEMTKPESEDFLLQRQGPFIVLEFSQLLTNSPWFLVRRLSSVPFLSHKINPSMRRPQDEDVAVPDLLSRRLSCLSWQPFCLKILQFDSRGCQYIDLNSCYIWFCSKIYLTVNLVTDKTWKSVSKLNGFSEILHWPNVALRLRNRGKICVKASGTIFWTKPISFWEESVHKEGL